MRRLVSALVRLFALAALGYTVYRLIADQGRAGTGSAQGNGTAPATTTTRRPRVGTKPGGTRRPPTAPPATRAATPTPSPPGPARPATTGTAPQPDEGDVGRPWVEPDGEGACPVSHPIKGKVESGIYHPPEGRHYERTKADRCYRDAPAAEADGLRRSKQ